MNWVLADGAAVVTGAGSGIGRAVARRLRREGMALALVDMDAGSLQETAREVGGGPSVSVHEANVADARAMRELSAEVEARHPHITLLINNAGVVLLGGVSETALEETEWVMGVNFWGVVHGVKYFLPMLRREPRAHIVNVSSLYGLVGKADYSAYCASKFAVRGYTEALRQELKGSSVGVSCAYPGLVSTQFAKRARIAGGAEHRGDLQANRENATGARTSPEAAAERIVEGVRKRKARILIGSDAEMWDRLQRALPGGYERGLDALKRLRR